MANNSFALRSHVIETNQLQNTCELIWEFRRQNVLQTNVVDHPVLFAVVFFFIVVEVYQIIVVFLQIRSGSVLGGRRLRVIIVILRLLVRGQVHIQTEGAEVVITFYFVVFVVALWDL